MQVSGINNYITHNQIPYKKASNKYSNVQFLGKTNFYAFTDVHQNAEKHCKMIWDIMQQPDKDKTVILDNGDIFKGLYPKYTMMRTYAKAKQTAPKLEIVYNIGNNDPGFMENDRVLFRKYLEILNKSGVKTISANIIDEKTGKIPDGISPYAIVERDGDKLLYVGFVVNKIRQSFAGMATTDPVTALEKLAPELKHVMEENNCKGMVMMVHDTEDSAYKLKQKAKELGFNPEFIIGGHVHHSYRDDKEKVFYPEPFALSMLSFCLNIDKNGHNLENLTEIFSDDCELGMFSNEIERAKDNEKFDEKIAKSLTQFNHRYQDEYKMEYSQLGTLYANGIKDLTGSDIGLVPKPWIYDTLPKKDGYITKLDILLSCPQPFRNIAQMELTPAELRKLYQYDIDKKSRLFEASENFKLTLDESNKIKQIEIDGKPLFNSDGYAIEPDKTIKVAIDYHTADSSNFEYKEIRKSMYDGIVYELKKAEKELTENQPYPTATLIRI